MPSGAKKRKALKKKKEQQAFGTSTDNNHHGNEEFGSQDERDSDGYLSSPSSTSQGNGEIWTRDLSPSPLSGLGKVTVEEKIEDADVIQGGQGAKCDDVIIVSGGMVHEENGVGEPPNVTYDSREAAPQEALGDASVLESAPVKHGDSSVSRVVISGKNEKGESATGLDSVKEKSNGNGEKCILKEAMEGYGSGSTVETNKEIKSVKESEVAECSEEKSLLPSGPPVVRTSWLSCCGLFDVMAGSER